MPTWVWIAIQIFGPVVAAVVALVGLGRTLASNRKKHLQDLRWALKKQRQDRRDAFDRHNQEREDALIRHQNELQHSLAKTQQDRSLALKKDVFVQFVTAIISESKNLGHFQSDRPLFDGVSEQATSMNTIRLVAGIDSIKAAAVVIHRYAEAANISVAAQIFLGAKRQKIDEMKKSGGDAEKLAAEEAEQLKRIARCEHECGIVRESLHEALKNAVNEFRKELHLEKVDYALINLDPEPETHVNVWFARLGAEGFRRA